MFRYNKNCWGLWASTGNIDCVYMWPGEKVSPCIIVMGGGPSKSGIQLNVLLSHRSLCINSNWRCQDWCECLCRNPDITLVLTFMPPYKLIKREKVYIQSMGTDINWTNKWPSQYSIFILRSVISFGLFPLSPQPFECNSLIYTSPNGNTSRTHLAFCSVVVRWQQYLQYTHYRVIPCNESASVRSFSVDTGEWI